MMRRTPQSERFRPLASGNTHDGLLRTYKTLLASDCGGEKHPALLILVYKEGSTGGDAKRRSIGDRGLHVLDHGDETLVAHLDETA